MKNYTLFCFLALFVAAASGQNTIRNSSFENWSTVNGVLVPDSWKISDSSMVVSNGALSRQSGGSSGSYGVKLGAYLNTYMRGAGLTIRDTLSMTPGGIAIDYYTKDAASSFGFNGAEITIYFYDSVGDYISDQTWGPSANNSTNYTTGKLYFSFTNRMPKSYLLEVKNSDINGLETEYAVVDNVRFIANTTGVKEVEAPPAVISVYPNPASDFIALNAQSAKPGAASYRIYTTDGTLVKSGIMEDANMELRIADLEKGIYLLMLDQDRYHSYARFIKQ